MEPKNILEETPISVRRLGYIVRISAWLLLVSVVILIATGWGITHTEIIYKATFGLVDRRLANAIHRASNVPLVIFFLAHVLINIRLIVYRKNYSRIRIIDAILTIVGLILMALVLYVEFWA
jgi:cytochrome b subunit of formate dehydrogenase